MEFTTTARLIMGRAPVYPGRPDHRPQAGKFVVSDCLDVRQLAVCNYPLSYTCWNRSLQRHVSSKESGFAFSNRLLMTDTHTHTPAAGAVAALPKPCFRSLMKIWICAQPSLPPLKFRIQPPMHLNYLHPGPRGSRVILSIAFEGQ